MQPELPNKRWFTQKECAQWLDMEVRQFRRYVDDGLFPEGVKRGPKLRVWSREDLLLMYQIEAIKDRFQVKKPEDMAEEEPEDDEE